MSVITYIGMGSNLGDSKHILQEAVGQLAKLGTVSVSQLYQSLPMGPQDQPNYHNAVAQVITDLEPLVLLDELQRIELEFGRVRSRHWGERTLDLDILLYGGKEIINDRLTVPHVGVLERDFVVVPLLDLDAELCVKGIALKSLDIVQESTLTVLADSSWAQL